MPTHEQIESLMEEIERLQSASYPRDGVAKSWFDLPFSEKDDLLREIEWAGFTEDQEEAVIGRVLIDEPPDMWAAGIAPDELFDEWRADHAAAKVRDEQGEAAVPGDPQPESVVEDFGISDIHRLALKIGFLQATTYEFHAGRAQPRTDMECIDPGGPTEYQWEGLNTQQRTEVLNRYVDWTEFAPPQADRIIDNIAAGKDRREWFDGVPPGWRGVGERSVEEWKGFVDLPEAERFREAAREMKESRTLTGDAVKVYVKWEDMNDRQQRDVVIYQLLPFGPELTLREREKILGEELDYRKDGPQRKARDSESLVSSPSSLTERYREISGGQTLERVVWHEGRER